MTQAERRVATRKIRVPNDAIWLGGAASGVAAGIFMAVISLIISFAMGAGFWFPTKLIAATFMGVDALIGGSGTVVTGVIIHVVASAIFGIIFAFFTSRVTRAKEDFGWGLLYGIAVWIVMTSVGLPLLDPVMSDRVALTPLAWFFEHLVFGASLTLTPYFERVTAPEEYAEMTEGRFAHA